MSLPLFKRLLGRFFAKPAALPGNPAAPVCEPLPEPVPEPVPEPIPEPIPEPAPDNYLFDDWTLPLTPSLQTRIKADVALRLPASTQPSSAQWKMIFSRTPSTSVVAGAGSGKSTSLVLRVLVMHYYLGFDLASMTVVTFTRESRADFIKKAIQLFDLWGVSLSKTRAAELVRTFHSLILPLVRSLPGLERLQAFETLGSDSALANPFDLRINQLQRQQMNQCYSRLLLSEPRFRDLIAQLRLNAFALKKLAHDHPDVQKRAAVTALSSQRDEELCDLIEDQWFRAGAWPIQGIEPQRKVVEINGSPFYCHGYIAEVDAWVVLGIDPSTDREMTRPQSRMSVRAEWAVKRTLFQAFCDKPLIWIDNYQDSSRIWGAVANDTVAGPGFDYRLAGELSDAPLLDAFFSVAGFIENLALDVNKVCHLPEFKEGNPDSRFFEALGIFWPVFIQNLIDLPIPSMTYNSMFASLGESATDYLSLIDDKLLQPMSHLMVDEFQDVSPQIVSWLRACLAEIRRRRGGRPTPTSLLCVGDDWQSIYGWRGSSPHYFIDFKQAFRSPRTTRVILNDNYRSHQMIIDAAEHLVRSVRSIPGKRAVAAHAQDATLEPVKVLPRDDDDLARRVATHLAAQQSVLILYRKTSDRPLIKRKIDGISGSQNVRLMTYHSAKGLQADAVFLVGDCSYNTESPYRNQVYRLAHLGLPNVQDPYDTAQRDEALRLAYVAITRAARHCTWYIDSPRPPAKTETRASALVSGEPRAFEDLR